MNEQGFYKNHKSPNEPKSLLDRAIDPEDLRKLLDTIKRVKQPLWERDHAAIFLGYHLALRISEACLLERKHFRHLGRGILYVPTLKRNEKVDYVCIKCGARAKLSAKRIGVRFPCARCQRYNLVKSHKKLDPAGPKEIPVPMVEGFVLRYAQAYLTKIPRDQTLLFAGRRSSICSGMLHRIFQTYTALAKLSPHLSWHSLRHARSNQISEITGGDEGAISNFLRQSAVASARKYMSTTSRSRKLLRSLEDSELKGAAF